MNRRNAKVVFLASAVVAFAAFMAGASKLPQFGTFTGAYTAMVLRVSPAQRHSENVPTAVNFDIRGFDTLGEEFIFFTSVTGVLFIFKSLRHRAIEHAEAMERAVDRAQSGAILWFPTGLTAFAAAIGMDVAAHGQLTPGGGFQGGAIFGGALACIYLGVGMAAFERSVNKVFFDALEAFGAVLFGLVGVAGLVVAGAFLANVLPLGITGATVSAGTIYLLSCAVFVEIGCGMGMLMLVFIKQTRRVAETTE